MSRPSSEGQSITYSSGALSSVPHLRFLHYNDVYHIDASSSEPAGGIARFQTISNFYRHNARFKDEPELLTLFSGDAFNPSLESSVTKGSHMVPFMNNLSTAASCVGNHDLDFGISRFSDLASKCDFPWLLANVLDPALGEDVPLGKAEKTTILMSSNGIKVGVIGLVEKEWLDTLNYLPPDLIFRSAAETAMDLAPKLRQNGAEMIVVLSHQREPNDVRLAKELSAGTIDIILGGHDHFYGHQIVNGTHILRSGTDFKQLSYIEARKQDDDTGWDFHIVRRDVVSSIEEDKDTLELVDRLTNSLKPRLEKPIGYTASPLDARFTTVRLKESNIGNFVCDIMRSFYQGDCCIMAAGTIRGDQIYPPGLLKAKDIMNCFPFEDPCVVVRIKGAAILAALENAVSTYPALEGRFPQVSNLEFEFDPKLIPHSRVVWVKLGGTPLEPDKLYNVVTRDYMARGKDGFTSLLYREEGGTAETIVAEENGILISMLLRQYFMSVKVLGLWHHWGDHLHQHWKGVHQQVHQTHKVIEPKKRPPNIGSQMVSRRSTTISNDPLYDSDSDCPEHDDGGDDDDNARDTASQIEAKQNLIRKVARKWWRLTGLPGHPSLCSDMKEDEFQADWTRAIAPRVEGRIKIKGHT